MKHFEMKWQWPDNEPKFDETNPNFNEAVYKMLSSLDMERLQLLTFKAKVMEIFQEMGHKMSFVVQQEEGGHQSSGPHDCAEYDCCTECPNCVECCICKPDSETVR